MGNSPDIYLSILHLQPSHTVTGDRDAEDTAAGTRKTQATKHMAAKETSFLDLIHAFTDFLTVCIHTILYERDIYPEHSFIRTRKYNYPVRQSRHPRVCKWITDAVAAVEAELLKCCVERVAVVIYSPQDEPLERFMFDVARFPVVPSSEHLTPLVRLDDKGEALPILPLVDLEEQFRAAMSRLSGCRERLGSIVEGCTYTVAVEMKDESEPPIEHPQAWIPAQPATQRNKSELGQIPTKTIPVRAITAGEMTFEMWIEEGLNKTGEYGGSQDDQ